MYILVSGAESCYITRTHKTSCWISPRCKSFVIVKKRCMSKLQRGKAQCHKISQHGLYKLRLYRAKCRGAVYLCRSSNSKHCQRVRHACRNVVRILSHCGRTQEARGSCKVSYFNCIAIHYSKDFCKRRFRRCISIRFRRCFDRAVTNCSHARCFNNVLNTCQRKPNLYKRSCNKEECPNVLRNCQKANLSPLICLKSYMSCRKTLKLCKKRAVKKRVQDVPRYSHSRRWRYIGEKCSKQYLECRANKRNSSYRCSQQYLKCHRTASNMWQRKKHLRQVDGLSDDIQYSYFERKFLEGCRRITPYHDKCIQLISFCRQGSSRKVCGQKYVRICEDVLEMKRHCAMIQISNKVDKKQSLKINCLHFKSYRVKCTNLILYCTHRGSQLDHICATKHMQTCERVLAIVSLCQLKSFRGTSNAKHIIVPNCHNPCKETAIYATKCRRHMHYCKLQKDNNSKCMGMYKNFCSRVTLHQRYCCSVSNPQIHHKLHFSRCSHIHRTVSQCLRSTSDCIKHPGRYRCVERKQKFCVYVATYERDHCNLQHSRHAVHCQSTLNCHKLDRSHKACRERRRICTLTSRYYPSCSSTSLTSTCLKTVLLENSCCKRISSRHSDNPKSSNRSSRQSDNNKTVLIEFKKDYWRCVNGVKDLKEGESCESKKCCVRYRVLAAMCYIDFYHQIICSKLDYTVKNCAGVQSKSCAHVRSAFNDKCTRSLSHNEHLPCQALRQNMRHCYGREMSICKLRRRYSCHLQSKRRCQQQTFQDLKKCRAWKRGQVFRNCALLKYKCKLCKSKESDAVRRIYCKYLNNVKQFVCNRAEKMGKVKVHGSQDSDHHRTQKHGNHHHDNQIHHNSHHEMIHHESNHGKYDQHSKQHYKQNSKHHYKQHSKQHYKQHHENRHKEKKVFTIVG